MGGKRIEPLAYIDSVEFHETDADTRILVSLPPLKMVPTRGRTTPYHRMIDMCEPISHAQQRDCFRMMNYLKWKAAQSTDTGRSATLTADAMRVREVLIMSMQRLVQYGVRPCRKRLRPQDDVMDLIAAGTAALIRCIDGFDYQAGNRFSTYALPAIRNAGHEMLDPEKRWQTQTRQFVIAKHDTEDPANAVSEIVDSAYVESLVRKLPKRSRELVCARFGLHGYEARTTAKLADDLGLSVSRVSQLIRMALDRIRLTHEMTGGCNTPAMEGVSQHG